MELIQLFSCARLCLTAMSSSRKYFAPSIFLFPFTSITANKTSVSVCMSVPPKVFHGSLLNLPFGFEYRSLQCASITHFIFFSYYPLYLTEIDFQLLIKLFHFISCTRLSSPLKTLSVLLLILYFFCLG